MLENKSKKAKNKSTHLCPKNVHDAQLLLLFVLSTVVLEPPFVEPSSMPSHEKYTRRTRTAVLNPARVESVCTSKTTKNHLASTFANCSHNRCIVGNQAGGTPALPRPPSLFSYKHKYPADPICRQPSALLARHPHKHNHTRLRRTQEGIPLCIPRLPQGSKGTVLLGVLNRKNRNCPSALAAALSSTA